MDRRVCRCLPARRACLRPGSRGGRQPAASANVDGRVVDGLRAAEVAGATLISAPDDWPAEQVVAAMTETLAAHSRDEVPH